MRLRFISAGAAQGLVHALAREAATEVDGSFGAVGAMMERLRAGEASDVVILTRTQIAQLATEQRVRADTVTDLGSVATSIAVREGHPMPDVSRAAPLREALVAADAIFFPDPAKATAGIHFAKVLDQLGIAEAVAPRLRTYANGATAMAALAHAPGHPIGCTQATEILATPGVRLVAPLPPGLDLSTVYTAAVRSDAAEPDAAGEFVRLLGSVEKKSARRAAGFE